MESGFVFGFGSNRFYICTSLEDFILISILLLGLELGSRVSKLRSVLEPLVSAGFTYVDNCEDSA